jgi:hypothetical protein
MSNLSRSGAATAPSETFKTYVHDPSRVFKTDTQKDLISKPPQLHVHPPAVSKAKWISLNSKKLSPKLFERKKKLFKIEIN